MATRSLPPVPLHGKLGTAPLPPWWQDFDLHDARKIPGEAQRQKRALLTYWPALHREWSIALREYAAWDHEDDHEHMLAQMALHHESQLLRDLRESIAKLDRIIRRHTCPATTATTPTGPPRASRARAVTRPARSR